MKRWASVQKQKPTPTADLTKSAGGMFHQEDPIRCGALTRAATAATRTKKTERETIPANLIREETVGGTVASGAHRKRARAGDYASAESDPPRHRSDLRSSRQLGRAKAKAYMKLTAKADSGKEHRLRQRFGTDRWLAHCGLSATYQRYHGAMT
jgi:hypothetical protein